MSAQEGEFIIFIGINVTIIGSVLLGYYVKLSEYQISNTQHSYSHQYQWQS